MKRIFIILIAVVVTALTGFQLFRNKQILDSANVVTDRSDIPVAVKVTTVTSRPVAHAFTLPATLIPNETADIPAAASGKITRLTIELGDEVMKNQLIGELDHEELLGKYEAAKLSLDHLKADYERQKVLVEGKAANANALTDAHYEMESKKWEVAELEAELKNTEVLSPIPGIITDKKKVQGEYATTGTAIATVTDVRQLKARIFVPENKVFELEKGDHLRITSQEFSDQEFDGVITYISPQGDENHNYQVQVQVANQDTRLKAGQYVLIHFESDQPQSTLQIPVNALVEGFKRPYVYLVKDNRVTEQKITLGRESGDQVEVLSGLTEHQQIVVSGQINLVNGSRIRVSNQ